MTVALLARDLMFGSRIAAAAERAGVPFVQVADPGDLPPPTTLRLLLVAWDERRPGWGEAIAGWCTGAPESARPRVIAFGPHTDLVAHADARSTGLGPMWARSRLLAELPALFWRPLGAGR